MSSPKNIKGYNKWSHFYDEYPNPTVAIDDMSFPDFYSFFENRNILEVGCGTGRHTVRLAKKNKSLVGIDTSEGMLKRAQQKIELKDARFVHGNFLEHSFQGVTFEAVVLSLVLEHIFNLNAFFEKANICLKSSGILLMSEIHPARTQKGITAHFKQEDGSEFHLESCHHSEQDIQNSAVANGFQVEIKKTIVGNQQLVNINPKWEKHLDQPMLQIWQFKKTNEILPTIED